MTNDLRYPVGPLDRQAPITPARRRSAIDAIRELPTRMRQAVAGLTDAQIDAPYRPGGWTVRQLVHHVADSHMNGYIRVKLALTEENPTIKPYSQDRWAELPDSQMPIEISLALLDGIHARWTALYQTLAPEQYARSFFHPETGATQTLDQLLQTYAWHSRHHVAHITRLREREGW